MRLGENPRIPEGINNSDRHPLQEFLWLLAAVAGGVIVLVVSLSLVAKWLAPWVPFSWERQLTAAVEERWSEQAAPPAVVNGDSGQRWRAAEAAIEELGAALARQLEGNQVSFRFHLVDSDTPNAFATLGGHIFVTRALLDQVSSENALAMVVGHEMAHIVHRHPIQALGRGAVVQLLLSVLAGSEAGAGLQSVLGQAGLLTELKFNRGMEREADRTALQLLMGHYGHSGGSAEFFMAMAEQPHSPKWADFLHTHPAVEDRIRLLQTQGGVTAQAPLTALDHRLLRLKTAGQGTAAKTEQGP